MQDSSLSLPTPPLQGKVYYFTGEFSAWSAQQILTPPDAVDPPKNHFGYYALALNKKKNVNMCQSFLPTVLEQNSTPAAKSIAEFAE
jgi:hypothetical protein